MTISLVLKMVDENGSATNWLLTHYDNTSADTKSKRLQDTMAVSDPVKVISPASKEIAFDLVQQGIHLPSEPENEWIKRFLNVSLIIFGHKMNNSFGTFFKCCNPWCLDATFCPTTTRG